jgi:hypothetical protein
MTFVEGESELSVAELEARLYMIGISASEWAETLEMGGKGRLPLEKRLIVPLNSDRFRHVVPFEGNQGYNIV